MIYVILIIILINNNNDHNNNSHYKQQGHGICISTLLFLQIMSNLFDTLMHNDIQVCFDHFRIYNYSESKVNFDLLPPSALECWFILREKLSTEIIRHLNLSIQC